MIAMYAPGPPQGYCEAHLKNDRNSTTPAAGMLIASAGRQEFTSETAKSEGDFNERSAAQLSRAYDRLIARLSAIDCGKVGPAVGQPMPNFLMRNQAGLLVSLRALLAHGPLVISFNRGHWCPYCKIDLRALADAQLQIETLGGQIVSIMPDLAHATPDSPSTNTLPFPVLTDIDLGYSLSLGLVYWVGSEVSALYLKLGIDLERYHRNGNWFLPLTAKFIVDRNGIVRARHVDLEFRQRVDITQIVSEVATVRDRSG
jgi:peroxiredoxin